MICHVSIFEAASSFTTHNNTCATSQLHHMLHSRFHYPPNETTKARAWPLLFIFRPRFDCLGTVVSHICLLACLSACLQATRAVSLHFRGCLGDFYLHKFPRCLNPVSKIKKR